MSEIVLRDYQQEAIERLRYDLSDHRKVVLQAPTGSGKTVIAGEIIRNARRRGKRVVFTVPFLSLVDQTYERFAQVGVDPAEMGIMQGNHPLTNPKAPIQIATIQTMSRRDRPEADLVIADECHIQHKPLLQWLDESDGFFVGLSATPWATGMGQRWRHLHRVTSMADLIETGSLSAYRVLAPSSPDLEGIKTVRGDYHEGELGDRMSDKVLVADVVMTWLLRGKGLPTLCFAVNRAHAQVLVEAFEEAGVSVAYVDAYTKREDRLVIGEQLNRGEVEVVVNIDTLTTGVDWDVRCLILARPTKSEMKFVQIIGRALRPAEGKEHALILDHSDTHYRLGMVADVDLRNDSLDMGRDKDKSKKKRDDEIPLPKDCKGCGVLIPPGRRDCPACGAIAPLPEPDVVDGELVEFTTGAKSVTVRNHERAEDAIRTMGQQQVYSELLGYCAIYDKKDGFAGHSYKEIYGEWPRYLRKVTASPSPLIMSWLNYRKRQFKKYVRGQAA